jgi:hypothetical protein
VKNQITERALACLNATNEGDHRSDYRDQALQRAALKHGGFIGAAVLLSPSASSLR